jgi:hypothetical protein
MSQHLTSRKSRYLEIVSQTSLPSIPHTSPTITHFHFCTANSQFPHYLIAAGLQLLPHLSKYQSWLKTANMNIAVAGNLPAMQAVSQHAQATWDVLRLQISPFTSVVTIDGHIFKSLSDDEKHWISAQYR